MVQSVPNSLNLLAVAEGKVLPPRSMALDDPGSSHFCLQASDGDQLVATRLSEYFAKLAEGFGLSRALGSLFSPLFLAAGLLSFEDVVRQAGVGKASASTGLRQLRQLRAVETVLLPGDRRTYYRAKTSVLRRVGGLLTGTLLTQLDSGDRLLRETANGLTRQSPPHWADRVTSLQRWQHNFRGLHPVLSQFGTG